MSAFDFSKIQVSEEAQEDKINRQVSLNLDETLHSLFFKFQEEWSAAQRHGIKASPNSIGKLLIAKGLEAFGADVEVTNYFRMSTAKVAKNKD